MPSFPDRGSCELVEYLARAIHPEVQWDNWDEMELPGEK